MEPFEGERISTALLRLLGNGGVVNTMLAGTKAAGKMPALTIWMLFDPHFRYLEGDRWHSCWEAALCLGMRII